VSLHDSPGSWPVVDSTDLHRDGWVVAMRRDRITVPGGDAADPDQVFGRVVVEHPGAALVLAIDDDERVCLIRQYRHPGTGTFVEIPAGLCDVPGEDPVETARRELAEEVALEADHWRKLLTTYPSVGITAEQHHFYLARGLHPVERPPDFVVAHEEAHLEVFWAPVDEVIDAVLDGRVQEGPLAIAVLAYDALQRRTRSGDLP
jgi:8-oxo-dGDP phosphatase